MKKIVYIAHCLGDGPDRAANCARASKWVAWAADQGVAPVCTWIVLAGQWSEQRREEGLAIDCALIGRCDEVWLCGPRVSPGMNVEASHAKKVGVPVYVLVDPSYVDGPPARYPTFRQLMAERLPISSAVVTHMRAMAASHGFSYEEFLELKADRVAELEYFKPTSRVVTIAELGLNAKSGQDPLQGDPK